MKDRILERIHRDGPMRFDTYMELSLYDAEDGFFSAGGLRPGVEGDFVTSPEVSPWFGRLLGRWASSALPGSDPLFIEVGAGSGSLVAAAMASSTRTYPGVYAVERSAEARRMTRQRLPDGRVVSSLDDVPGGASAILVLNEVWDNTPTRLVSSRSNGWSEIVVAAAGGRLELREADADPDLSSWCDRRIGSVAAGSTFAAPTWIDGWLGFVRDRFGAVAICSIDYGASSSELASRPRDQVVRTYLGHRSGPDHLDAPGTVDVTVDVNVDVVRSSASDHGFDLEVTDQRSFLGGLGAGAALDDLERQDHEAARAGDIMEQLRCRSEATGLRALMEQRAFGGFQVFLLETGTQTGRANV